MAISTVDVYNTIYCAMLYMLLVKSFSIRCVILVYLQLWNMTHNFPQLKTDVSQELSN